MTVEEIFGKVASHMKQGIVYHEHMSQAYEFLSLWGFAHCQDSHQYEEERNYKQWLHYYFTHYFKLLTITEPEDTKIIPELWHKYSSQAVDMNTRKSAIKDLMKKWIEWEKSTKIFYQTMRTELVSLNEIDAALELDKYIRDVSKELSHAEKKLLTLEAHNYDMPTIVNESNRMLIKYKKKLGW